MMPRKQIYSFALRNRVEDALPVRVKEAMSICGWDAIGVYETVRDEIRREKRAADKKGLR